MSSFTMKPSPLDKSIFKIISSISEEEKCQELFNARAKFHISGAHFFLFKLPVAAHHVGLHLIDVETLTHPQSLAARHGTRTELAPFRHGTFSCKKSRNFQRK
jgi:hypothetical protein